MCVGGSGISIFIKIEYAIYDLLYDVKYIFKIFLGFCFKLWFKNARNKGAGKQVDITDFRFTVEEK